MKISLHRYAVIVAIFGFLVIALGAYLTSTIRPLPGTSGAVGVAPGLKQVHVILAGVLAALTLGLAIRFSHVSAWLALGLVIIESALGSYAPVLHAILAPILFSDLVAIALLTSENWARRAVPRRICGRRCA